MVYNSFNFTDFVLNYFIQFDIYILERKGQQKTPISRRENGVLESGTDETRTRDLRLDRPAF